jgi:VanZ family protein
MWSPVFRAAGWLAVFIISVLSLVPGQGRPQSGLPGGFEHLSAYFIAALLLVVGYPDRNTWAKLALLLIVLSGALEILQLWVPGRRSELAGFLASSSGATLGTLAGALLVMRRRPPRQPKG